MKRMTYQEWGKLTPEQQDNTPDTELPEIRKEELCNGLTESLMVRMDGERFWQILSRRITTPKLFPEYKQRDVAGVPMWYKCNPMLGTYEMNLTGGEPSLIEEPIGEYGTRWMKWMKENYNHLVTVMQHHHNFLTVARSVDKSAWEHWSMLMEQYTNENPIPKDYMESVAYHGTLLHYLDSTVMREKVLIPVTQP